MTSELSPAALKLFYSYSHQDDLAQRNLERHLYVLKDDGVLEDWSDRHIMAGQSISSKINEQLSVVDIFVFLITSHFIASQACLDEWNSAKALALTNPRVVRVPIIISPCAWQDFLGDDDILVLPKDGKPVESFANKDEAWIQVYEAIKKIISQLQSQFTVQQTFIRQINNIPFVADGRRSLSDTFIFPRLLRYQHQPLGTDLRPEVIKDEDALLSHQHLIIHGAEMSGKTALARHLYSYLLGDYKPTLLIDMNEIGRTINERILRRAFAEQITGDYRLWKQLKEKTIIIDNLASAGHMVEFVKFVQGIFGRIIIFTRTDAFLSYYQDDDRLSDYAAVQIDTLTYEKQELIIRK